MHLAQINVSTLIAPLEDPRIDGFRNALDAVNALAERSPGFIWRLKGEGDNATDLRASADPLFIVNMSVWDSVESLEQFVWNTVHTRLYHRRDEWMKPPREAALALWWSPIGEIPTLNEGIDRLAYLRMHGDTDHAFGWANLKKAVRWREQRCRPLAAE